jgi:hypothetical protein
MQMAATRTQPFYPGCTNGANREATEKKALKKTDVRCRCLLVDELNSGGSKLKASKVILAQAGVAYLESACKSDRKLGDVGGKLGTKRREPLPT